MCSAADSTGRKDVVEGRKDAVEGRKDTLEGRKDATRGIKNIVTVWKRVNMGLEEQM